MKFLPYLFVCLMGLPFFSCKSRYLPDNYNKEQILFGSGGGFTGVVSTWCLQETGRLFFRESLDSTFMEVKKLSREEVGAVFTQLAELGLNDYQMERPGNMYSFIQLGNTEEAHRIVWDKMNPKIKPEVKAFYEQLMDLTQITE